MHCNFEIYENNEKQKKWNSILTDTIVPWKFFANLMKKVAMDINGLTYIIERNEICAMVNKIVMGLVTFLSALLLWSCDDKDPFSISIFVLFILALY